MIPVCFTVEFLTCCNKVTVWLTVGWKLQDHYCRVLFQYLLLGDDYLLVHIRIWHSVWFLPTQMHGRLISFLAVYTFEGEKLSQSIKTLRHTWIPYPAVTVQCSACACIPAWSKGGCCVTWSAGGLAPRGHCFQEVLSAPKFPLFCGELFSFFQHPSFP